MLKPTPVLQFKGNQFLLMKNYRQKLKEIKASFFRFYSSLLLAYYIIQIVLHFAVTNGYIFDEAIPMAYLNVTADDEKRKFYVVSLYSLVFFEYDDHFCNIISLDDDSTILLLYEMGQGHLRSLVDLLVYLKRIATLHTARLRSPLLLTYDHP
jgi:hypothetical protein